MTYGGLRDEAQPICPSCGITMHPLIDEGIDADECRECGFQLGWSEGRGEDDEDENGRESWW